MISELNVNVRQETSDDELEEICNDIAKSINPPINISIDLQARSSKWGGVLDAIAKIWRNRVVISVAMDNYTMRNLPEEVRNIACRELKIVNAVIPKLEYTIVAPECLKLYKCVNSIANNGGNGVIDLTQVTPMLRELSLLNCSNVLLGKCENLQSLCCNEKNLVSVPSLLRLDVSLNTENGVEKFAKSLGELEKLQILRVTLKRILIEKVLLAIQKNASRNLRMVALIADVESRDEKTDESEELNWFPENMPGIQVLEISKFRFATTLDMFADLKALTTLICRNCKMTKKLGGVRINQEDCKKHINKTRERKSKLKGIRLDPIQVQILYD